MMAVYKACMSEKAVAVRMLLKQIAKIPKIGEKRLAWEVIAVSIDDYFVEYDRETYTKLIEQQRKNPKRIYAMHRENKKLFSAAEAHSKARKFFFESTVFEFWSWGAGLDPEYVRRILKAVEAHKIVLEPNAKKTRLRKAA